MTKRPLRVIAEDISQHWPHVNPAAKPYLVAMYRLSTLEDQYGFDDAKGIVLYFLSNASTWRGPDARRIKAELKAML